MDDMSWFVLGYAAGKKKGGGGVQSSRLSIEGIKKLKTVGTLSFGSVVYEIKEPFKFFGGVCSNVSTSNYYGLIEDTWWNSVVVNGKVACLSYGPSACDTTRWSNHYYEGTPYNIQYSKCSDFKLTGINYNKNSGKLWQTYPQFTYTVTNGYDDIVVEITNGSSNSFVPFYQTKDIFTNLIGYDYLEFVKSCYEEQIANINDGVVDIFEN